ncbi:hypothetical protein BH10ACI3_BH10ACI3_15250 [soil metagenome]
MKKILINFTYFTLITLLVTFSATAQNRAYRVSDRQVQNLLNRIENNTNSFKNEVDRTLDRSNIDGTRQEDSINSIVSNFENATDTLKTNFSDRRSTSTDVDQVLQRAVFINSFMRNNRMSQSSQNLWSSIRADLNTLSGYYRTSARWDDTVRPTNGAYGYTVTDSQMRTLLNRLTQRSSAFIYSYNSWNSRYNRNNQSDQYSNVSQDFTNYTQALNNLNRNYNNRNAGNVDQVLRPSAAINSYLASTRTNNDVTRKWNLVRTDLNTLASYYRVNWNWDNNIQTYPNGGNQYGNFDSRLTGTYRLNTGQSDNVTTVVDAAMRNANYDQNQQDRARRMLERRLQSPETLTFEKNGQQVTMSSSNAPQIVLNADGIKQTETSPNGRTVTTSVTATNRDLTINYEGDRANDYYVTFAPANNGQLRVTRRVYLENQNTTVTATSVYDKTSQTPMWNTSTNQNYPTYPNGSTNGFIVPNNTNMVATLDSAISTRTANDGDRFSMTVNSPSQFNGAVIEGNVVGQKSGVVSGKANLSLSFNTIRMRDGRIYTFAGLVTQVRNTNGDIVSVNNEGQVSDSSQTTKTVVRAGLGAALGAIIGAIAGGGSGAAIGAGVGAGAGAGTVLIQGRDNLELSAGTQFSITATAPANVGSR